MHQLCRTVRFCVNPGDAPDAASNGAAVNGFGSHPAMRGLGRYYELRVSMCGTPDPGTGYLVDIKTIDRLVREIAIPRIAGACEATPEIDAGGVLASLAPRLGEAFGGAMRAVSWRLTPYYEIEMRMDTTDIIVLRQSFDFCAAHRLHAEGLSDEDNVKAFGKCNNPNSHGHNYRVDTEVRVGLDARGAALSNTEIESIVDRVIIEPFDHTNLNLDTEVFGGGGGVNPSVENMARVFYGLLGAEIGAASERAKLESVTVWETDRTSCRYPG
jgi:6-pyruvoyltetrahydropterin/6-carboxytetrahydropterin synthase